MVSDMWTALCFAIVGIIHLLPIAPVFAPDTLTRLYGVAPDDATQLLLLRHRALLLALVGALCLWAVWVPAIRPAALVAAGLNIAGFLALYALYGGPPGPLRTIALADVVAMLPLAVAAWSTLSRR